MSTTIMKRGDLVEVKNAAEILGSLDGQGTLDGLLFMPEMIPYCGRRFTVARRADKICDTIQYTGSRRLRDAVLLEDLRCDGSHHDNCQAECRLFWKEQWLRRVTPETPPGEPAASTAIALLKARTVENTRASGDAVGQQPPLRYRCQATELQRCTDHLKLWDPMSYVREYTSGNVTLTHFLKVVSRAAVLEPMRKLGLTSDIHVRGTAGKDDAYEALNLQPGELVRVKALSEIVKTLTPGGRNKGLWFDREMMQYCGQTFRVRQRISRFINDQDRRMIELKNDAVTLDGAVCTGDLSLRRWFCSRAIYPYWRECWLERVHATERRPQPSRTGSCGVGCS